jgi:hypothetical protein
VRKWESEKVRKREYEKSRMWLSWREKRVEEKIKKVKKWESEKVRMWENEKVKKW